LCFSSVMSCSVGAKGCGADEECMARVG
jgi:hypothetical protein